MITLCKKCEATLLAEIAETTSNDVSGYYCSHNHATAVVIAQDGEIKFSQISGPCNPEQAAQLMQEFVRELHTPIHAHATGDATEIRH